MRITRNVTFTVKTGKQQEFNKAFEDAAMPILKKQEGFEDSIVLNHENRGLAISVWNNRKSAEAYDKAGYAKVLDTLRPFIEGTPKVEICEVAFTTMHAVV